MPLDSLEFTQNPLLAKLGRVERLLATERQWCKGRLRDGDGRHCLVGAIEAADAWKELARIVLRAAREVSGKRYWRIESFNDDPRTTHAQVLAVLRVARQHLIAEMAREYDREPWHRRWVGTLRRWHSRTATLDDAAPNRRNSPVSAASCSSTAQFRLMTREGNEVS
jgi:hypothetical protein